jgi:prolyl 4-hydroxylase
MTSDFVGRAKMLLSSDRLQEAMNLLGGAAREGDPDALEMLAEMALIGDVVVRDLALSRDLYARAAQAGSVSAAAAYRAFVANGTGGPADWQEALRLLEKAAPNDLQAEEDLAVIAQMELGPDGGPRGIFDNESLSRSPDIRLFPGLFSPMECHYLIHRSQPLLHPSVVIDPRTGGQMLNPVRTSHSSHYPLLAESPGVHALCRRLAAASGSLVEQGEPLQVLRYSPGQEYRPHFDAIANEANQRVLTFLVYLNDDYEGGETEFLASGLKVKGRKGDGLLFRNADDTGVPDAHSRHAGLPVLKGEKYLASRWIRERPILAF